MEIKESIVAKINRIIEEKGSYRNLRPVKAFKLKNAKGVLVISSGSVVDFEGDAVVNAANEGCQTGGGVDGKMFDLIVK